MPGNWQAYPLIDAFYTRGLGVGVRHRGRGRRHTDQGQRHLRSAEHSAMSKWLPDPHTRPDPEYVPEWARRRCPEVPTTKARNSPRCPANTVLMRLCRRWRVYVGAKPASASGGAGRRVTDRPIVRPSCPTTQADRRSSPLVRTPFVSQAYVRAAGKFRIQRCRTLRFTPRGVPRGSRRLHACTADRPERYPRQSPASAYHRSMTNFLHRPER